MFGKQENTLWVESFRPDTLEGYIGNEHIIEKVKIFISNGDVPHLLFYGSAGTGKTTLAKIIANSVEKRVLIEEQKFSRIYGERLIREPSASAI
jgi:Holliday junction resolvasome RuvABC ATP-dependent DNA helicase subunit